MEGVERRLREKWPDRPEGYVHAAHRLVGDDRCEEAFTLAMQSLRMEDYPGYIPLALGVAGRARLCLGDAANGLTLVRDSLALEPDQPDLNELMATVAKSTSH